MTCAAAGACTLACYRLRHGASISRNCDSLSWDRDLGATTMDTKFARDGCACHPHISRLHGLARAAASGQGDVVRLSDALPGQAQHQRIEPGAAEGEVVGAPGAGRVKRLGCGRRAHPQMPIRRGSGLSGGCSLAGADRSWRRAACAWACRWGAQQWASLPRSLTHFERLRKMIVD